VRYCKENDTQLQFIFEACEVSVYFPLGVKTTYRAYSASNIIEIIDDPNVDIKLRAISVEVNSYPTAETNGTEVDGMYVLQKCPENLLLPYEFSKPVNSNTSLRQPIIKTMNAIEKYLGANSEPKILEWNEFLEMFPEENETVAMYINRLFY